MLIDEWRGGGGNAPSTVAFGQAEAESLIVNVRGQPAASIYDSTDNGNPTLADFDNPADAVSVVAAVLARDRSIPAGDGPELESIVDDDTLVSVAIISRMLRLARAVAFVQGSGPGTGFLIAPNLLLTNNHVVSRDKKRAATADEARRVVATFNFEQDEAGRMLSPVNVAAAPDVFFRSNVELDFAVVALAEDAGVTWGIIDLADHSRVNRGDDVFIIQHPGSGPKQIAMSGNSVAYSDDHIVQYVTDTKGGSSGSPVFDYQFRICALHHSGGDIEEPESGKWYFRNEGISIRAIFEQLRDDLPPAARQ